MSKLKNNCVKTTKFTCSQCGFSHVLSKYPFDISEPLYERMVDFLAYILDNMDMENKINMPLNPVARVLKMRAKTIGIMIKRFMELKLLSWYGKAKYEVNVYKLAVEHEGQYYDNSVQINFDFKKIWLQNMLTFFDSLDSQKYRFVLFLINNMDANNIICMTRHEMIDRSNISIKTIVDTMNRLMKIDFLQILKGDVYKINLDKILDGDVMFQDNGRTIFINENIRTSSSGIDFTKKKKK